MKDIFDEQDRGILKTYIPLVKGISLVSGPNCEVSLHSLEDMEHSVIAIENGFITGRKIGSGMIPLIRDRLVEYDHEHWRKTSSAFFTASTTTDIP